MNILMISHFTGELTNEDNDRFKYLAKKLAEKGNNVELVTSDYDHHLKKYRKSLKDFLFPFKVTLIHEREYKKNISIKRAIAHVSFARNLKKYLKKISKPDIVYCSMPPILSTNTAYSYSKKNNIKFVLDVQDLWPESFSLALNRSVAKLLFSPLLFLANKLYRKSDFVFTVSQTFLNRINVVRDNQNSSSVYLGTDLSKIKNISLSNKSQKYFYIGYIGSLGRSYNIKMIIDGISHLISKGITNIVFLVIGDGEKRKYLIDYSNSLGVNCIFTGRMKYEDAMTKLAQCNIAVNPISEDSSASIVNKVGDYAALSLPVISTQNSEEYNEIITNYQIGEYVPNNDISKLSETIASFMNDKKKLDKMGKNNKKLFDLKFNRNETYNEIINEILKKDF